MARIFLTANLPISSLPDVPLHLQDHLYDVNDPKNQTFSWKVIGKISKFLYGFSLPLNSRADNKVICCAIDGAVDYLEKNTRLPVPVGVHVKIASTFHSALNTFFRSIGSPAYAFNFDSNEPGSVQKIDKEEIHAQIVIGTKGLMGGEKQKNFCDLMNEKFGIGRAAEFVLFHEIGHSMDWIQEGPAKHDGASPAPVQDLLSVIERIRAGVVPNTSLMDQYYPLTINNEAQIFDNDLMNNLSVLKAEIYADTYGFLELRNYDIARGIYQKDKFGKMVTDICDVRNQEHDLLQNLFAHYNLNAVTQVNHLTTPGLIELLPVIKELDDKKTLTPEEINTIARRACTVGLCKTIYTLCHADNSIIPEINGLFNVDVFMAKYSLSTGEMVDPNVHKDETVGFYDVSELTIAPLLARSRQNEYDQSQPGFDPQKQTDETLYQTKIKGLVEQIPPEWLKNFEKKLSSFDSMPAAEQKAGIFKLGMGSQLEGDNFNNLPSSSLSQVSLTKGGNKEFSNLLEELRQRFPKKSPTSTSRPAPR